MAWTEKADFTALNALQVVDALADNDTALLAAISAGRWHNSRFDIWQRGTSFASGASQFGPDRHRFRRAGNATGATLSRQAGFRGARYSARVARDVGNTSTAEIFFTHQFDSEEIADLAGQTIYIAADMIAGANFSAAGGLVKCRVDTGTGFNETISEAAGFATGNSSILDSANGALSTTSERKFFGPFAIPANATELAATFSFVPVGTAGAADFFQITNIKPCADAPELYKPLPIPFEWLIALRFYNHSISAQIGGGATPASSGRAFYANIVFPVPMRIWSPVFTKRAETLTLMNAGTFDNITSLGARYWATNTTNNDASASVVAKVDAEI